MTTYLLAYLLAGFVLSWIETHVFRAKGVEWGWELAGVILWPLTAVIAMVVARGSER